MIILAVVFLITFLIGVPVSFALGIAGLLELLLGTNASPMVAAVRLYTSMDSFPLLAIPLFTIMGHLMECCGVLSRLIKFLGALLGPIKGGMAYINILASMLFAGVSGTAVADISSMGYIEMRMMEKSGYPRDFSAAVTAASSIAGPIIPPSLAMVVFALAVGGGISIGGLFMAGIIPGLLMGIGLITVSAIMVRQKGVAEHIRTTPRVPRNEMIRLTIEALPLLLLPLIVLGGIMLGIFTVTEAAAVGVVYALFIGFVVTRELRVKHLPLVLVKAAITTGTIAIIFGAGNLVSWILTINQAPQRLAATISMITTDPHMYMLLVFAFLVFMGCVMEANASIILLGPILYPIAIAFGIHPYTFGLVFVMTLEVGLITPPVGVILFLTSSIGNISLGALVKKIWPFALCQFAIVLLAIFFPPVTLFVPRLLGF